MGDLPFPAVHGLTKGRECPGSGKYPKQVTMNPNNDFTGFGICSECTNECSLTRYGLMHRHKRRTSEDGRT